MSKFCGNCGSQMQDGVRFCGNCGWDQQQINPQMNNTSQIGNQGFQQNPYQQPNMYQGAPGYQPPVNNGFQQPYQQPYQQAYSQPPMKKKSKGKGCIVFLVVVALILFGIFKGFGFVVEKIKGLGVDIPEIALPNIDLPFGSKFNPQDMNGTWSMTIMTTSVDASSLGEEYQQMYNAYLGREYTMNMKFDLDETGNGIVRITEKMTGMEFESPVSIESDTIKFDYQDESGMISSQYEAKISSKDGVMLFDGKWETAMTEPAVKMTGVINGSKSVFGESVTGLDFKKAKKEAEQSDYLGVWEGTLRFDIMDLENLPEMTPEEKQEMISALGVDHRCKLEVLEEEFTVTMYLNLGGNMKEEEMDDMPYDVTEGILSAVIPEEDKDGGKGGMEMMIVDLGSPKNLIGRIYMEMPLPNGNVAKIGLDMDLEQ